MSDNRAMSSATPAVATGRAMNITLWVVQVLLAVLFAFAGLVKLAGLQAEVDAFTQIGLGQWFRYVTGALELAGAIGLLIPRLCGLAALGLVGVMVGAAIVHLTVLPPAGSALVPAAFGIVLGLIAWARRPQRT
ncbi:MAG: DoxX family protein [Pseudonocardiaceae bacterium]